MTPERLDELLTDMLADDRISRGEKRVLAEELEGVRANEQKLGELRHRAFQFAREKLISPEAHKVLEGLESVVKLLQPAAVDRPQPAEAYFSPHDDPAGRIVSLLRAAAEQVDICVFTITHNPIAEAIEAAHRRGVAVRIITDNDKADDRGSDIHQLRAAGVPVRCDRSENHMHHKYAIFDRRRMLTGSYNWTRSAADKNEENLIVSYDPALVEAFAGQFQRLWERLG